MSARAPYAKLIPEAYRARAESTGLILTGLFAGYLMISLFGSVFGPMGSYHSGEVRPSTGIPAWVILFSGVVSFTMITARSFAYGARALNSPSSPTQDTTQDTTSGGEA